MKKQIVHLSVHQTSKVIAAMYAVIFTVLIVLPWSITHWFHGQIMEGLVVLLFMPFIYWVILYIGHVVGCLFYNWVAQRMGGIEFEVKDLSEKIESAQPLEKPILSDQQDHL